MHAYVRTLQLNSNEAAAWEEFLGESRTQQNDHNDMITNEVTQRQHSPMRRERGGRQEGKVCSRSRKSIRPSVNSAEYSLEPVWP